MSESGGRRIKRALHIDMSSIKFCTDETLESFKKFALITDYIAQKQEEINEYNREHGTDTSQLINGRRQTNIGVFRAYIIAYLKNHPKIHQDMTFLVRHLEPKQYGLPVQIYVFSNDQAWANYEAIQADIFDHLLAALPEFGLRIFQNPTGYDFKSLDIK
jgi:miniconductance mechanosensitive channel